MHSKGGISETPIGVLGGIRGYTPYTNLRGFLTAYTHLSDHPRLRIPTSIFSNTPLETPYALLIGFTR